MPFRITARKSHDLRLLSWTAFRSSASLYGTVVSVNICGSFVHFSDHRSVDIVLSTDRGVARSTFGRTDYFCYLNRRYRQQIYDSCIGLLNKIVVLFANIFEKYPQSRGLISNPDLPFLLVWGVHPDLLNIMIGGKPAPAHVLAVLEGGFPPSGRLVVFRR